MSGDPRRYKQDQYRAKVRVYRSRPPDPPFTPTNVGGLALWIDSSDASTLTATNGVLSGWADKSGNARHFGQATASRRPLTGQETQNGLNVVTFDGFDDYMLTPFFTHGAPATLFAVVKTNIAVVGTTSGYYATESSDHVIQLVVNGVNNTWRMRNSDGTGSGRIALDGPADTNPHMISAVFNFENSELRVDGVTAETGQSGTNGAYTLPRVIGHGNGGFGPWNGWIAEILHYDHVLSAYEITSLETYLRAKWATPGA